MDFKKANYFTEKFSGGSLIAMDSQENSANFKSLKFDLPE